jgi:hypothetical protein
MFYIVTEIEMRIIGPFENWSDAARWRLANETKGRLIGPNAVVRFIETP